MKKVLTFTAHDKRFGYIWQALVLANLQDQKKRTFETMRREARLVETLERISVIEDGKTLPGGDPSRVMAEPQTIVIEQADLDLLKTCIEEIQWKATATPGAVDAHDFLASAPELGKDASA